MLPYVITTPKWVNVVKNILAFSIIFSVQRWCIWLKSFLVEEKDRFILHNQYHGCWPGNPRSQGIGRHMMTWLSPNMLVSTPEAWGLKHNYQKHFYCQCSVHWKCIVMFYWLYTNIGPVMVLSWWARTHYLIQYSKIHEAIWHHWTMAPDHYLNCWFIMWKDPINIHWKLLFLFKKISFRQYCWSLRQ